MLQFEPCPCMPAGLIGGCSCMSTSSSWSHSICNGMSHYGTDNRKAEPHAQRRSQHLINARQNWLHLLWFPTTTTQSYICSITQPLRGRDKASSGVLTFFRRQEMMSWPTLSAILLLVFTHSGTQFDAVGPERNKYRNE